MSNATVCLVMLWLVCGGKGSRGRYICLLGLSNSGKTLLFMRVGPCPPPSFPFHSLPPHLSWCMASLERHKCR